VCVCVLVVLAHSIREDPVCVCVCVCVLVVLAHSIREDPGTKKTSRRTDIKLKTSYRVCSERYEACGIRTNIQPELAA
jgi:hypothetical protein